MAIFEVCVTGYEDYCPKWFEKDCSNEEFIKEVESILVKSSQKILNKNSFINGYKLQEIIVEQIEKKGFKPIKPDCVVDLKGEGMYKDSVYDERPSVIPPSLWEKIIKHNDNIWNDVYDKRKKKIEK